MSKTKPTGKETIALQAVDIINLRNKSLEYDDRLAHLAERCQVLAAREIDAAVNYSIAQETIDDLEIELRQARHTITQVGAQAFSDIAKLKDKFLTDTLYQYAFGTVAGIATGFLIWGI